ncbi:MAG: secondary thiamine-phosphate synthase enzyme YjbQ [Gaiellaceae bacterium]
MATIAVRTERRSQLVDITREVREAVAEISGAAVLVYVPHTTAAVTINEHIDPELLDDLADGMERVVGDAWSWRHDDADGPNGPSHLRSTLVGAHVVVPLRDGGALALGTYQGIFLCEFDGPRDRSVHVSVLQ